MKKLVTLSVIAVLFAFQAEAQTNKLAKFTSATMPSGLSQSLLFDNGTGVGIGTTNPAYKFVVSNAGAAGIEMNGSGGVNNDPFISSFNRTSSFSSLTYNSKDHYFQVQGVNALTIIGNASIGIGTTSPSSLLHLYSTTSGYSNYLAKIENGNADGGIKIGVNNSSGAIQSYRASTGVVDKLLLNPDGGNIGIGTINPPEKLSVLGNILAYGGIKWGGTLVTNSLLSDQGGCIELGAKDNFSTNPITNGTPYIDFHYGTGTAQDYNMRIINVANNRLDFAISNSTTIMSINDNRVGIGTITPNPSYKLDVAGPVNATQFLINGVPLSTSAQWQSSGSNIYYNSGNVGVGTNNPINAQLHLVGGVNKTALYLQSSHSVDYGYCIRAEVNRPLTKAFVTTLNGSETFKLNGNGIFFAKGGWITVGNFPDYVFDDSYERASYLEKAEFFKKYKHLPQMKSAKEIEKNGLDLGESLSALTLNIEENSLDIIDLYKMITELKSENEKLKKEIKAIKTK